MTDVAIRQAISRDARSIATVMVEATRTAMPYLPELYTDEQMLEWITNSVLPRAQVHVAERNGVVVGFLALRGGALEHLYVHPRAQRQGVGSMLLEHAKSLRAAGFTLWVFQRNTTARGFYEKRGLKLVRLTDGSGNEEHEPDALYEWHPGEAFSFGA